MNGLINNVCRWTYDIPRGLSFSVPIVGIVLRLNNKNMLTIFFIMLSHLFLIIVSRKYLIIYNNIITQIIFSLFPYLGNIGNRYNDKEFEIWNSFKETTYSASTYSVSTKEVKSYLLKLLQRNCVWNHWNNLAKLSIKM